MQLLESFRTRTVRVSDYNYSVFPLDMEQSTFEAFPGVMTVGQRAPGGDLVDAASGEPVSLTSLWRSGPLVMEFGSLT